MDTGLRTSSNAGIAGGLAVVLMWILGWQLPEAMDMAPAGLEAAFTVIIMTFFGRISKTPKKPGIV